MSSPEKKKAKSLWDLAMTAAYLNSHNAKPRSLFTAVVSDDSGKYPKDVAVIKFDKSSGEVQTSPEFMPSDVQQAAIKAEFEQVEWPKAATSLVAVPDLPSDLKGVPNENIFELWYPNGCLAMLHVRYEGKSGKYFEPWTYFDDAQWRKMEPDGKLPLYGLYRYVKGKREKQLFANGVVFLHEGPKGVRTIQKLMEGRKLYNEPTIDDHPWGDFLASGTHLAYIGGANAVNRTDFSVLRKAGVQLVIIVADKDEPGRTSVAKIASELNCVTKVILFNHLFPQGFDLGDDFPKEMFGEIDGKKWYVGPDVSSLLHDATFAIYRKPTVGKKFDIVLRPHFLSCYYYISKLDLYVDAWNPTRRHTEKQFNNLRAPFSDVSNLAPLFQKARNKINYKLCYDPGDPRREIIADAESSVNVYIPSPIKAKPGDIRPFDELMEYFIPDPDERHILYRWCYTLIACPEINMKWAILLASNQQGVGKSTLGMDILGPLVGETNVSVPSEANIIDSSFNGWQANKRLAIVNEIYSGQSWKAYNKLKSSITDPKVTLNEKYIPAHSIANWIHIFACSNSDRALKLEDTDRRWFVPTVTEEKWPDEKFDRFHIWLKSGGLSIIKDAAEKWDKADYVKVGEAAPDTKRKQEMVYDSLSPAMSNLYDLVAAMKARETSTAVTGLSLMNWLKKNQDDKMFDTLLQFRKAATKFGLYEHKERVTVAGRAEYLLINPAAKAKVDEMTKGDFEKAKINKWLKEALTPIDDIIPPVM